MLKGWVINCCRVFSFLLAFGSVLGCASNPFQPDIQSIDDRGVDVVTRNPELDVLIFKEENTGTLYCASVETDAVPAASQGVGVTVSGYEIKESGSASAVNLGGLSPAVHISRELLYRSCEAIINFKLTKEESLQLYRDTMAHVANIAASDKNSGTKSATPNLRGAHFSLPVRHEMGGDVTPAFISPAPSFVVMPSFPVSPVPPEPQKLEVPAAIEGEAAEEDAQ